MVTERNARANSGQPQHNRWKFWTWSPAFSKAKMFRTEMHMVIDQGRVVPTKYITSIKSCLTCIKFSLPVRMKKELFERLSKTSHQQSPEQSPTKRSWVSDDTRLTNTPTKHTKFPKLKNNIFLVRDRLGSGTAPDQRLFENQNNGSQEIVNNNNNANELAVNNDINNEIDNVPNLNDVELLEDDNKLICRNNAIILHLHQPSQALPKENNPPQNVQHDNSPQMTEEDRESKVGPQVQQDLHESKTLDNEDTAIPCSALNMATLNVNSAEKLPLTPLKTCMTYYASRCRWNMRHIRKDSDFFILLPDHIVSKIFGYLATCDLAALKCTCNDFKWVIEEFNIVGTDSKWCTDPRYQDDPCMQCGKLIDPRGDVSLCRWHPKIYYKYGYIGNFFWTCCFKIEENAAGCTVGLHDNNWMSRRERLKRIPRRRRRKYMPKQEIDYAHELLSD